MKKLIGIIALAALALAAVPAAAYYPMPMPMPSNDITVNNSNSAMVCNDVTAVSDTGDNKIMGTSGMIITGDAGSQAWLQNQVNSNDTRITAPCPGCSGDITVNNANNAMVMNDVTAVADTGDNKIKERTMMMIRPCGGYSCGMGSMIITGDAGAYADALSIVNSNVTRITR